jgi:sugar phosphate isomerase/epimerase
MKLGSVSNLIPVPEGEDQITGRITRAAGLGLSALSVGFPGELPEPAYLEQIRDLAESNDVVLHLGTTGVNFYHEGAEGEAEQDRAAKRLRTIIRHTGIAFAALQAGPMRETHRWVPGPPIPDRLATLARTMGAFADRVSDTGVMLGLENHCDYRGHEIASIITQANRPNLRVQLDTGNAFSVFEEPVDCAAALAPYVVSVHLKDIQVTPFAPAPCRGARGVSVPLGEGDVDNVTICRMLQEQAPNPDRLPLLFEPFYLPEDVDPAAFMQTSLTWARANLAPFLTERVVA